MTEKFYALERDELVGPYDTEEEARAFASPRGLDVAISVTPPDDGSGNTRVAGLRLLPAVPSKGGDQ